ncbi:MAG: hypothetical protein NTW96_18095 [Planctomycetia bacterium]|nr:hypothetical protein [Planctomycetia bacterium]
MNGTDENDKVRQTLRQAMPDDVPEAMRQRMQNRLTAFRERLDAKSSIRSFSSIRSLFGKRTVGWTTAVATAALLVAVLLISQVWHSAGSVAWAEVVKAVAQKPWLHAVMILPDGKKGELWFSADRAVMATRTDKEMCWGDLEQKTREYYDPGENTIVRVPDDEGREASSLFETMFRAFLSSETGQTISAGRFKLVHQEQRVMNENGKRWIEHRFKLHDEGNQYESDSAPNEWVVYVDPDTLLPCRWDQILHFKEADKAVDPSKRALSRCEIDYPETGPTNIYALGAPKTAKVLDRLLDPSRADVKRLVAGVRAARWRSDKYYALVVEGSVDQHWSQAFPSHRIWRNGSRWRVERSFGFDPQPDKLRPENVDPAAWWRQKLEKVRFVPEEVCDGKWLWHYLVSSRAPTQADIDAGAPKDKPFLASIDKRQRPAFPPGTGKGDYIYNADNHPEYLARPLPYLVAPGYSEGTGLNEVKLDAKPASGPPNTVLLEVHNSHWTPGGYHPQVWRYWIDPEQGYLVMRYEELESREGREETIRGHAIEEVTQDPGGQWYPTVIRLFKRNVLIGSDKPPYDGIMRCYYDFTTPLPEGIFETD